MDKKKTVSSAAALIFAFAAGAGAQKVASPSFEISAKVTTVRILGDGQIAVGVLAKVGTATVDRELVYDKTGENPRLNGVPIEDEGAVELGKAAAALSVVCDESMKKLADRMVRP